MTPSPIPSPRHNFKESWTKRLKALRDVPAIVLLVWESGPSVVTWGLILRVLTALSPLGLLAVARIILDGVVSFISHGGPLRPHFWWWVGLEFAIAAVTMLLTRATDFTDALLADRYVKHISVRLMKQASSLDLATYEDPGFHDKLERARVQATDRLLLIQQLGRLLQQVIATIALAAGIVVFMPWLLLLLLVCVVPAFLWESHFAFLGYNLAFRQTPAKREMDYLRFLGVSKESAKELKVFGLNNYLTSRFASLADQIFLENVGLARRRFFAGSFLSVFSTAGYYGAYAYVVYEALHSRISVGTLQFLAGAIAGASLNLQSIFSTFSGIADQALFLSDLISFLELKPRIHSNAGGPPCPRPIHSGIEFRNVSFVYPGTQRAVLHNLNLRFNQNERVALIGENGQGKTTIVKLLTRLYDPSEGAILLDGVDLREYDLDDYTSQVAVIFQDFVRYDMTAMENIGIGRVSKLQSVQDIIAAAQKSRADEVVGKLQLGYQQMLGRRFDGGVDLSGGEWQKVALARAYLRDAQILILDEPTASLDAKSEQQVFQQFAELTQNKLSLLISHRFSTVRMADRILVLEDGCIVEEGHHTQLMARDGKYAEMFEMQASNYR
ncbi:MAG TPA: ABC transporter ATP-binding protein [Candidatus Eisenbacteria bacterium]|nr:ABC transporter ATP-binding protein [Candidatus Eisenbacteria bacterium]